MKFDDLGLSPEVLQAVKDAGYETPTPIQEQAIPYVLMGRDVLGCAQTGTGKTASFTLPMIDILANGRAKARMPRSLIITPTRELATQIADNFEIYGKYYKLTMALLIGGVSFEDQIAKLDRGVDVLIATPGRLLDHFERGRILLTDIKILVIDEADRMMDMGFMPDVERIVSLLPKIRNTLFFSATMPPEIRRLADKFLINPKEITVTPNISTAETIEQFMIVVSGEDWNKRDTLRKLIEAEGVDNALVFCNRKRDVDILNKSLRKHGFNVAALHGDMSQPARLETLQAFKDGTTHILVASDVAARGLDLPKVSHVFNFDVPIHAEDYVHRIGRTGRAGRKGRSLTIATPDDAKFVEAIVKFIGKPIPPIEIEGVETVELGEVSDRRRGRGGKKAPRKSTDRKSRERKSEARPPAEAAEPIEPAIVSRQEIPAAPRPKIPGSGDRVHSRPAHAEPSGSDRNKRRRERGEPKEQVLGMGDHTPAFLLRPARVAEN